MSNAASTPEFRDILQELYDSGKYRDSGSTLKAAWIEYHRRHGRSGSVQKQRYAMRKTAEGMNPRVSLKSGPGKFEGERYLTRRLYEQGFFDEEIGSVDELGWFGMIASKVKGRVIYAIISEDSQGFVYGQFFKTHDQLNAKWSKIEQAYSEGEE